MQIYPGITMDPSVRFGKPCIAGTRIDVATVVGAILDGLRQRGERITTARRALLTALDEAPDHCSADDLAAEVARRHPEIHRATIYRTLETLRRLEVVEHTHLGHGPAVYHLACMPRERGRLAGRRRKWASWPAALVKVAVSRVWRTSVGGNSAR